MEGVTCLGGRSAPLQQYGFWVQAEATQNNQEIFMYFYRCNSCRLGFAIPVIFSMVDTTSGQRWFVGLLGLALSARKQLSCRFRQGCTSNCTLARHSWWFHSCETLIWVKYQLFRAVLPILFLRSRWFRRLCSASRRLCLCILRLGISVHDESWWTLWKLWWRNDCVRDFRCVSWRRRCWKSCCVFESVFLCFFVSQWGMCFGYIRFAMFDQQPLFSRLAQAVGQATKSHEPNFSKPNWTFFRFGRHLEVALSPSFDGRLQGWWWFWWVLSPLQRRGVNISMSEQRWLPACWLLLRGSVDSFCAPQYKVAVVAAVAVVAVAVVAVVAVEVAVVYTSTQIYKFTAYIPCLA